MKDAFKVGDKVWVIYPRSRKKPDDLIGMRQGIVHYIGEQYLTIWVAGMRDSKQGWRECFMFHDIIIGKISIIPRKTGKLRVQSS